MKYIYFRFLGINVCLCLFFLAASCVVSATPESSQTITNATGTLANRGTITRRPTIIDRNFTSTNIVSQKPSATNTLALYTPFTTVSPNCGTSQINQGICVRKLLSMNNGCSFPCFWGITPGATSFQGANGLFTSLGSTGRITNIYSQGTTHEYVLRLPELDLLINIIETGNVNIINTYYYTTYNKFIIEYNKSIAQVTPRSIFQILGEPDGIYLLTDPPGKLSGFTVMIYYERAKFLVYYQGRAKSTSNGIELCFSKVDYDHNIDYIYLVSAANSIKTSIVYVAYDNFRPLGGIVNNFEDRTSISVSTFYKSIINSSSYCVFDHTWK